MIRDSRPRAACEATSPPRRLRGPAAVVAAFTIVGATIWLSVGGGPSGSVLLSFGLLGLAAGSESRDGIERLTENVRRLEAGDYDVDFPTDRDDDLGRLAEALDEMAVSLRERKRERDQSERCRRKLYEITSDTSLADEAKIERLLELGCERLGVENGHVVRIDRETGRHEIVSAAGSTLVQAGAVTDLEETYCRKTIDTDGLLSVYNAPERGWQGDPAYELWDIGCYLGGKILVQDELYGTVCFVDQQPLEEPFTHAEKAFVDLVSRWLSHLFERREHTSTLRREKERFESLVREVEEYAIFMLDPDGRVRTWNEGGERIKGYDAVDIIGEHFSTFYTEADREAGIPERNLETAREEGTVEDEGWRVRADGSRFWANVTITALHDDDGAIRGYTKVTRDMTERRERERELERTKELLEQAGRVAGFGGWELDVTTDPPEMTWTDELYAIHDVPPEAEIDIETTVAHYHPDDREYVRERFRAAIERGDEYDVEVRALTGTDEVRWVRAIGEPVREDGEIVAVRGSIQDITERKERELALASLHEATRGLLATETEMDVAQLTVETAEDVLDVPGVALYLLDDESNTFEPTSFTPGFAELTGGAPSVAVGDDESTLWSCFASGTPIVLEDPDAAAEDQLFEEAADGGLLVPIGDHGVFVVAASSSIDDGIRRLSETLVATTEAAFDRLESEASLRERDAELAARNRRLRRQVQINDIIRSIDQSLIRADSREEIESVVPERLVEAEDVTFAWIGAFDPGETELVPRAWTGEGHEYLDAVSLVDDADTPAVVAARTESPTVVENVVDRLNEATWPEHALAADFHSVVAVPLVVDEYAYGVLAVYADEPDTFGDLERSVFAELGVNIANSITAVGTRAALHAEALQELTLGFDEPDDLLARVARATGARVDYEGHATRSEEETLLFFTTSGGADDVQAALDDLVSVREYRLVDESDDGVLFEATVAGEVLAARLVRHGGSPKSIDAAGTELEAVVDVSRSTDVREFVEMLQDRYPSAELLARRDVQRPTDTSGALVTSLLEALTDRQLEVLRTAYYAGFFEWPRASTGEEIAAMLDVSQPTVNRHLRHGQRRLLAQLFEE